MQQHRYFLTTQLGTLEARPLGSSDFTINWGRERDGSYRSFNKAFEGNVTFTGDAYKDLVRLEKSVYRCGNQQLVIEKNCGAGWEAIFSGNISLNNGDWDLDRCSVVLSFTEENEASCFLDNDTQEINLLQDNPRFTLLTRPGNITIETVPYSSNENISSGFNPDIPVLYPYWGGAGTADAGRWAWYEHYQSTQQQTVNPPYWNRQITTRWAREVMTLPAGSVNIDPSWSYISTDGTLDKYAREISRYNYRMTNEVTGNSSVIRAYYDYLGKEGQAVNISNGVRLVDVLNKFIYNLCPGLTIKSDFFQINPEKATTINYVTGLPSKVMNLFLFSASDVKRPLSTGKATILNFDWERLSNALYRMFNVVWRVSNDTLILEHVSFFTKELTIDVTSDALKGYFVGKNKYTYQTDGLPYKEDWQWQSKQSGGDFKGLPIVYDTECVVNKRNIATYPITDVVTDVMLALQYPDSESSVVDDESLFFIAGANDGTNWYIMQEPGIFGGSTLNNTLGLAQLMRDYQRHERPFLTGTLNNQPTEFLSVLPSKQGVEFEIPFCCPNQFNADSLIKTPLGMGEVDSATYNFKTSTLKMSLLYSAYDNLTPGSIPVANFDNVNSYDQSTILIDVLANDVYQAGDVVEIVMPPALGSATVTNDNKISFTINLGGAGTTRLTYRIKNSIWGNYSDTASVNINILAVNQPPVANTDNYSALQNTQLVVAAPQGVLANDTDDYGGLFVASYDQETANGGTVNMQSNGAFTYDPPLGYSGSDTFNYVVQDDGGLQSTGVVNILVQIQNLPITRPDVYQVQVGKNLNVDNSALKPNLLANDYTLDNTPITAFAESKQTPLGNLIYILANGNFTFNALSAPGADVIQYTAVGQGGSAQGQVTVKVLPVIKVGIAIINSVTTTQNNNCNGNPTPSISVTRSDVRLSFFDANNQPIDVTGLGLNVRVRGTYNDLINGQSFDSFTMHPVTGTTTIVGGQVITLYRDNGCTGALVSHYNFTFAVAAFDGYDIL